MSSILLYDKAHHTYEEAWLAAMQLDSGTTWQLMTDVTAAINHIEDSVRTNFPLALMAYNMHSLEGLQFFMMANRILLEAYLEAPENGGTPNKREYFLNYDPARFALINYANDHTASRPLVSACDLIRDQELFRQGHLRARAAHGLPTGDNFPFN